MPKSQSDHISDLLDQLREGTPAAEVLEASFKKDLAHKITMDLLNKVTPFLTPDQIRQIQKILISHGVVKKF